MKYIHELKNWPKFTWDNDRLTLPLSTTRHAQGRLLGHMEGLGFQLRAEAVLQSLTEEVIKSSEIEGEHLDRGQVRSSVARRLGMNIAGLVTADRNVEGVVEMMLDATQNFKEPLTRQRLFAWHNSLFPTGHSGMSKIRAGAWRNDKNGPMQVVSGPIGREHVHYQAPAAAKLSEDMKLFLKWFRDENSIDGVLKAGLAHLWFVTIHPFDDGNGRIARAIADMALAQSENSPQRFYSLSKQISLERTAYYDILESTQKGGLDVTQWLEWFLGCLHRALQGSEKTLSTVLQKSRFWEVYGIASFNERQKKVINRLFEGFDGKLTSSKWAAMGKCSQDTANRDIDDLLKRGILKKSTEGGRSTSYSLAAINNV
ncbi:MAG: cell filamentation protein Fic [Bdellovibrio sp. 28-41-41]|nr:MAG: cell filamentation protein Fic [Bdellovibrio sp. 28-41-41]